LRIYILAAQYFFKAIMTFQALPMWWVDLCQLSHTHPAALSLPFLNRAGGQNKIKKTCGSSYKQGAHLLITVMGKTELTWGKLI